MGILHEYRDRDLPELAAHDRKRAGICPDCCEGNVTWDNELQTHVCDWCWAEYPDWSK